LRGIRDGRLPRGSGIRRDRRRRRRRGGRHDRRRGVAGHGAWPRTAEEVGGGGAAVSGADFDPRGRPVCDARVLLYRATGGADAEDGMRIFLMDRKLNVSEAYLRPGFAFGGSCLPKDLRALVYAARAADVSVPLLAAIRPSNEGQIRRAVEAVLATRKRRIG